MKRWKFSSDGPTEPQRREVAQLLRAGEVLILPTDTIYGFHADATNPSAIERIYDLKQRSGEKALPILCGDFQSVKKLGASMSREVEAFLERSWPAPLTAVLCVDRSLAAAAGKSTIAVRVPALAWLREMLLETGPLASTSVNRSGDPPVFDVETIGHDLLLGVAGVADAGVLAGAPSTIIDLTGLEPKVLREGAFDFTQNLWKTMWNSL